jgi:hypothetical protein
MKPIIDAVVYERPIGWINFKVDSLRKYSDMPEDNANNKSGCSWYNESMRSKGMLSWWRSIKFCCQTTMCMGTSWISS